MTQKEPETRKIESFRENGALESPVSDEHKAPKGDDKGGIPGEKKKEEPGDDESWVM